MSVCVHVAFTDPEQTKAGNNARENEIQRKVRVSGLYIFTVYIYIKVCHKELVQSDLFIFNSRNTLLIVTQSKRQPAEPKHYDGLEVKGFVTDSTHIHRL